ncbi:TPM domain-containing protein [Nevskia sp.]|uniref:TPM domain-containing protein n=1 Tax=Nevskia sp. TaxID=1929292 RepID=UPI003F70EC0A
MPSTSHPLVRWFRHLSTGTLTVRRAFPPTVMARITEAVRSCERRHAGEIRFVIEAALEPRELWSGLTPRERALEVFSRLRVWDTEHNNGVLIYLLYADHAVEIVADRGVGDGRVDPAEWQLACRRMREHFRAGRYADGAIAGIETVADVLARHESGRPDAGNELPDAPLILR